jgi:N-acetylglutamate synthase-like GNAT family acetyltransferase
MFLAKVGILPSFRGQGLGQMIFTKCEAEAQWSNLKKVFVWLPDLHCNPGDPDDVSVFVNKCGYRATGQCREAPYKMYGKPFELYRFEKELL